MATKTTFRCPASIVRRDGEWQPVGRTAALVVNGPDSIFEGADPATPGETVGENGHYVFLRGRQYEITPEIAAELAEVEPLETTLADTRIVEVRLANYIRQEEIPEPRERVVAHAATWPTTGQADAIGNLEARLAALESPGVAS